MGCLIRWLSIVAALVAVAAIAFYLWLPHPTGDAARLNAIKAETQALMAAHPITPERWASVPQSQWPPTIASLHPTSVTVFEWGVDIQTKPYFDGGWGYGVPRTEAARKMLAEMCYSEAGQGVLWHVPC